jgi:hypothetical protein
LLIKPVIFLFGESKPFSSNTTGPWIDVGFVSFGPEQPGPWNTAENHFFSRGIIQTYNWK